MKFLLASWCFFLLLFATSCSNKKNVVHHRPVSSCEARLVDVPFPLQVIPKELDFSAEDATAHVAVEFYTTLSGDQLGDFYHKEMEQYGWKELCVFNVVDERLLLFEKPFKFCVISIRLGTSHKSRIKNYVRYSIGPK
jgi:hypothetical protein